MKLVGAEKCPTPCSAPTKTSGSIQFWKASWPIWPSSAPRTRPQASMGSSMSCGIVWAHLSSSARIEGRFAAPRPAGHRPERPSPEPGGRPRHAGVGARAVPNRLSLLDRRRTSMPPARHRFRLKLTFPSVLIALCRKVSRPRYAALHCNDLLQSMLSRHDTITCIYSETRRSGIVRDNNIAKRRQPRQRDRRRNIEAVAETGIAAHDTGARAKRTERRPPALAGRDSRQRLRRGVRRRAPSRGRRGAKSCGSRCSCARRPC